MKRFRQMFWQLYYKIKRFVLKQPTPFQTVQVTELPDNIKSERIYLVGENGYLWSVALLCPCRCGAVIQLNLLPDAKPCWRVEAHEDETVSLYPSVWSRKGCGSHYHVRRGLIKWH